ncbi:MAG: hypothetical protein B7Y02_03935, partial [Rhodobacterales bacterium 17-64-5]
ESNRLTAERYLGRKDLFLEPVPGPEALLADAQLPAESLHLMNTIVSSFVRELGDQLTAERLFRDRLAKAAKRP